MQPLILYLKRSFQKNSKNYIFIIIATTLTIMLMTIVTVFTDSQQKGAELSILKFWNTSRLPS